MKCISAVVILSLAIALAAVPVMAQQPANHTTAANPLVQLLQTKGILTAEEASSVNQASSAEDANARLAQLLVSKGLISDQDYRNTFGAPASPAPTPTLTATTSSPHVMDAVYHVPLVKAEAPPAALPPQTKPETSSLPPGIAPLRVLPIDLPKQGGLIPDIKLGSGANMKLYGFFKATAVEDTASSGGATFGSNDFPLPLLIGGDTGPTPDPQFHIKDRSFRIGSQFEWVPKGSPNLTLTGKVEADFEGDYTNVNNRNISGVRSSQFSIRVAYMRLDTKLGGKLPWFAQFGQDWALISSSLPSLFETTGLGIGMGTLWERQPMFKTGVQFKAGDLQIEPDFAITLPVAGTAALTDEERARFGERAGAESNRPGLQGRLVFQFPLHHWAGVVPAQIIFSGSHAQINEIIPGTALTATSAAGTPGLPNTLITGAAGCADPLVTGGCSIHGFFPHGIENRYPQNVWTAEVQLPTPWVTFVAKYFKGDDMRFFFAGQLNDVFANLQGTTEVGAGTSFSGRSILFGCPGGIGSAALGTLDCQGNPIIVSKLQPIAGQGGFAEMSFPLSRIFHANVEGYNSGWVFHLTYSTDRATAADVRHGNGLARTDLDTGSITYKLNKWVTFVNETSYINTWAATAHSKLFSGHLTTQAHNWRNEFGPVFVF